MADQPVPRFETELSPPDFGHDFGAVVVEAAPDGIIIVDLDGAILLANQRASAMFGYDHDQLMALPVDDLLPDRLRGAHEAHREEYRAAPSVRPMGAGLGLRARRRDGSDLPVEISLSPLDAGGTDVVVAVIRDISARVEADERLRHAQRALAIAEDRERIARDLHDTVIQRLFASGLQLQAVTGRVDPDVASKIEDVVDGLDETIRDLRTAIFALHTSDESARGLRSELLDVVVGAAGNLGFEPRLEMAGAVETVDERVRGQLAPVVREALSNVARHARATSVKVLIDVGDSVVVSVVDDGRGISDGERRGTGLANLAERAHLLGGDVVLRPGPGGGTDLRWRVPSVPPSSVPAVPA